MEWHGRTSDIGCPALRKNRTTAERRRARNWAAASAEGAIRRLKLLLAAAQADARTSNDPLVHARLAASAPALELLCHGQRVDGPSRLRRNVAWHAEVLPHPEAPLAVWRAAQRGPRLVQAEHAGTPPDPRCGEPLLSQEAQPYVPLASRPDDAMPILALYVALRDVLAPLAAAWHPSFAAQELAVLGTDAGHGFLVQPEIPSPTESPPGTPTRTRSSTHFPSSETPDKLQHGVAPTDMFASSSNQANSPSLYGGGGAAGKKGVLLGEQAMSSNSCEGLHVADKGVATSSAGPAASGEARTNPVPDGAACRNPVSAASATGASPSDADVPLGARDLSRGQLLEIFGLAGRADLNGVHCILIQLDVNSGRWQVQVPPGHGVKVRPENLRSISTTPSSAPSSVSASVEKVDFCPFISCREQLKLLGRYAKTFPGYTAKEIGVFLQRVACHLSDVVARGDTVLYNCNADPFLDDIMKMCGPSQ